MVQVISAMAHHGYLEQPGGEVMVDYIVQQCALPAEEVRTHLFLDLWVSGSSACVSLEHC